MSNKTSSLERPTLAERFVGIFHLPFLGGCLLVGFVLLGRPLNYLDFYVSGFVFDPVEFTFRNLFGIGEPLDPLFNLITGLLHTSYFFVPGYVRKNLMKAKQSVVPLLPGGEVEYQKIFGRVSA